MAITKRETARGFSAADAGSTTLSNSTTETALFTHVVGAGCMGTNKILNFQIFCTLTTVLLTPTITIRVKFGSSTLVVASALGLTVNLTASPFLIEGQIINNGAAVQMVFTNVTQTGTAMVAMDTLKNAAWTIDTTANQTFQITAQFGALSVSTVLTFLYANVDLN